MKLKKIFLVFVALFAATSLNAAPGDSDPRRTGKVWSYRGYSTSHAGDSETSVCISAHNMIPYLDEGTLYIQNQTLTDGGYYEAKNIKVGRNVTTTQSEGNVNFSQGNYHLVGREIELQSGTTISLGATMEIRNK